jgi:flagellar biosynthesis protein FlhB
MAESGKDSSQEKTEQPTQRRLDKAREEGKAVTSKEMFVLTSIIMMLVFMYFFSLNFNEILGTWKNLFYMMEGIREGHSPLKALKSTIEKIFFFTLIVGIPVFIVTIFTQAMVGGVTFSTKSLEWKNSKISPIEGFKRIFSVKGLVEMLKGILKVVFLFGAGLYILYNDTNKLKELSSGTFENALITASSFFPKLIIVLIIILLLIAILDWTYQKYNFLKSLRMNRQDLKDESKETEGSPEVKAKIRRLQYQISQKAAKQAESIKNVDEASAIIVNPTHFAVALKYEVGSVGAPSVLAMGRGVIAEKIIEKGKEKKIHIFRHKLLARALYFTSDLGQEISDKLYTAVAVALAYIYKINNGEDIVEPEIEVPYDLQFNEDGTDKNAPK